MTLLHTETVEKITDRRGAMKLTPLMIIILLVIMLQSVAKSAEFDTHLSWKGIADLC